MLLPTALHFLLCFYQGKSVAHIVATSYMWLFEFKLVKVKYNLKFSSSVALATSIVKRGRQLPYWII